MVYFLQCLLIILAYYPELQFDIQFCQGLDYISLILWAVLTFDVVVACRNALIFQLFMLGTVFVLCILVKSGHFGFKKAPMDSTSVASKIFKYLQLWRY